jgi:hypothetical protein
VSVKQPNPLQGVIAMGTQLPAPSQLLLPVVI